MDVIIHRLRTEPALVTGILTSLTLFVIALATGGGTLAALLPVLATAILRQFVTPAGNVAVHSTTIGEDYNKAGYRYPNP